MSGRPATAAQLDAAIDALLGEGHRLRAVDEDELITTARLLRDALPRFHPRFGFEEILARRLSEQGGRPAVASAHPSPLVRPWPAGPADGTERTVSRRRLGLLAGGAVASGLPLAISIAGAALLAWRRSRASGGVL